MNLLHIHKLRLHLLCITGELSLSLYLFCFLKQIFYVKISQRANNFEKKLHSKTINWQNMWNGTPFRMHGIPKIGTKTGILKPFFGCFFLNIEKRIFLIHNTKGQVINPEHKTKLPLNRVSVYIAK